MLPWRLLDESPAFVLASSVANRHTNCLLEVTILPLTGRRCVGELFVIEWRDDSSYDLLTVRHLENDESVEWRAESAFG